jgi:hypothetical protein
VPIEERWQTSLKARGSEAAPDCAATQSLRFLAS